MKKFKINYTFEGKGEIIIEAENQEEAEDKFYNGDYPKEDLNEEQTNFEITRTDTL